MKNCLQQNFMLATLSGANPRAYHVSAQKIVHPDWGFGYQTETKAI